MCTSLLPTADLIHIFFLNLEIFPDIVKIITIYSDTRRDTHCLLIWQSVLWNSSRPMKKSVSEHEYTFYCKTISYSTHYLQIVLHVLTVHIPPYSTWNNASVKTLNQRSKTLPSSIPNCTTVESINCLACPPPTSEIHLRCAVCLRLTQQAV